MNKIVREHYPVSKLPDDLRQGLDGSGTVKVVSEEENTKGPVFTYSGFSELSKIQLAPMNLEEALENVRRSRGKDSGSVTMEEAVGRIRALRDEWEDE
jgi:hypothetical protein